MHVARRLTHFYLVDENSPSAFSGHLLLTWNANHHTHGHDFHVLETLADVRALHLVLVRHLVTAYPHSTS